MPEQNDLYRALVKAFWPEYWNEGRVDEWRLYFQQSLIRLRGQGYDIVETRTASGRGEPCVRPLTPTPTPGLPPLDDGRCLRPTDDRLIPDPSSLTPHPSP